MNPVLELFNPPKLPKILVYPRLGRFLNAIEPVLRFFGIFNFSHVNIQDDVYKVKSYQSDCKECYGHLEVKLMNRIGAKTYTSYNLGSPSKFDFEWMKPSEVYIEDIVEEFE